MGCLSHKDQGIWMRKMATISHFTSNKQSSFSQKSQEETWHLPRWPSTWIITALSIPFIFTFLLIIILYTDFKKAIICNYVFIINYWSYFQFHWRCSWHFGQNYHDIHHNILIISLLCMVAIYYDIVNKTKEADHAIYTKFMTMISNWPGWWHFYESIYLFNLFF